MNQSQPSPGSVEVFPGTGLVATGAAVLRKPPPVTFGAIDVGSNSIHLMMVEISPDGDFEVLGRDKDMVRIGEGGFAEHRLSGKAMDRAIDALHRFNKMCELKGIRRIHAVATSAVREARNGGDFVERVEHEVGLRLHVISREEEGRLIYLGVRHAVDFGDRDHLIVDIGGGSIELIVGNAMSAHAIYSLKLGGSRLAELFMRGDPPSDQERKQLRQHLRDTFNPVLTRLRGFVLHGCVGTSGSIKSLALLARNQIQPPLADPDDWTRLQLSRQDVKLLATQLSELDREQRRKIPGMDDRRVDSMVPVARALQLVMSELNIEVLDYCDSALREGVVIDHIARHRERLLARATWPDPRRRSVMKLAERCRFARAHAEQVCRLGLQLFDQLGRLHGLDPALRELFAYACILHDVGYLISHYEHHRHSYYLISNGQLKGFSEQEIEIIANVARYHRKNRPKKSHNNFMRLDPTHRDDVQRMAVLLRLANALDRTHYSVVDEVVCALEPDRIVIEVVAGQDAELELWTARRHGRIVRREFGVDLEVRLLDPVESKDVDS